MPWRSIDAWFKLRLAQSRRFYLEMTPSGRRAVVVAAVLVLALGLSVSSCSRRRAEAARATQLAARVETLTAKLADAEHALALLPTQNQVHNLHLRLVDVERYVGEERVAISNLDNMKREFASLKSRVGEVQRNARVVQSAPPSRPKAPSHADRRPLFELPEIKIEPKIEVREPTRGPPKHSVDIIVKSVRLAARKRNGKRWDIGDGAPDPKVRIKVSGGESGTTQASRDTYSATFNEKVVRVSEGDTIEITVYDQDEIADDTAGTYTKQLTADTFKERSVTWSFDQVEALSLDFQP